MQYRDYYKTLGVSKQADEKEIRKAYRKLARQYHPDVNPGNKQAEARFKEINEAYEVLSDGQKRREYDHLGADWQAYQGMGRDPSGFDWGSRRSRPATQGRVNIQYDDLSDLFGDSAYSEFFQMFFGGRPSARSGMNQRPRSGRGRDAEHPVEITLEEAFKGTQRIVLADGRRLEVKIPAGVRTGSRVRVAGEGSSSGSGGAPGDLYLVVQVQPHPIFTRDGDDLRCQVTASLFAAVLGGEIAVPTPTGRASLRIPPGTQPGQVFRLRGLGMPKLRGPSQRGNLLVQVAVRLPEHLTDEQKELFQELAGLDGP